MGTLWTTIVMLLVAGGASAWIRQAPSELTVDDALAEFRRQQADREPGLDSATGGPRASPGPSSTTAPTVVGAAPNQVVGSPTEPVPAGSSEAPPAGSRPPKPPAEGVYPFRTRGYERMDAFGGSRHDYPPETTVTVRHRGCGVTERWQPLEERWDETDLCGAGERVEVRAFRKFNRFFQYSQTQEYRCPEGNAVWDRTAAPGASWRWKCQSADAVVDTTISVVGHESMRIEGREIAVVRMRYTTTLTGSVRGTQVQERLLERVDGQVLMVRSDVEVQFDGPFGTAGYEEHYLIEATSTRPLT